MVCHVVLAIVALIRRDVTGGRPAFFHAHNKSAQHGAIRAGMERSGIAARELACSASWLSRSDGVGEMTDNQKNDLCLFLELFRGFDESSCEFTDVPDLIVHHNGKVVGIEHTRLYREDPTIPAGRQL
jgi:hypothetical protein